MNNVAFLGTGLLGGAMVERMLAQGRAVVVWNRTESKARALERLGARVAASPAEAVEGADRVHLALADDRAVDQVLAQVAGHVGDRTVLVDHSTTGPAATAERLGRTRRFLHAPVFMSPAMCRAGKGLMMVSGPTPLFEAVQPALAAMTGDVWYVGERPDLAAAYKLFGNAMIFVIVTGLADVLTMARSLGVAAADAVALFERFQPGVAIPMRGDKMARGDFSPMFELLMARKDAGLMLDAAAGAPLAVLPGVVRRMDDAIGRGHGHDDMAAVGSEV